MEKKALGRGLSALITPKDIDQAINANPQASDGGPGKETILQIPISKIKTNKYQPRLDFNEEKLKELTNSIKEKGVVQPILVRKSQNGYEIIAGERRLRAVKALGQETVPAIVKDVADVDMLELALIENIQREELNPMEEAHAFHKFMSDFSFTQDKIAQVLGKDRSTVANILRLLNLPGKIQNFLSQGAITTGHAKALLGLQVESSQLKVCDIIVEKGLSVRETENLISRKAQTSRKVDQKKDPQISDMETSLRQALGTQVKITHGKKRGKIQIEYYSANDLNRITDLILAKKT
jgi:ParB family transcriptional regulator, chromosome partitioning protein